MDQRDANVPYQKISGSGSILVMDVQSGHDSRMPLAAAERIQAAGGVIQGVEFRDGIEAVVQSTAENEDSQIAA